MKNSKLSLIKNYKKKLLNYIKKIVDYKKREKNLWKNKEKDKILKEESILNLNKKEENNINKITIIIITITIGTNNTTLIMMKIVNGEIQKPTKLRKSSNI